MELKVSKLAVTNQTDCKRTKSRKEMLTVYKEGEVFVGAVSDENGTSFHMRNAVRKEPL